MKFRREDGKPKVYKGTQSHEMCLDVQIEKLFPSILKKERRGWDDLMGVATKPLLVTFEKLFRMG